MTKELVLNSAKQLVQVAPVYAVEYQEKMDALVEVMNRQMASRLDVMAMVGENNLDMMKDNHANHARFMGSVFESFNPEVLTDTVLWVFRAYRSRNFSSTYWVCWLNSECLKK